MESTVVEVSNFFPYNAPGPLLGPGYNGWKAGKLDENIITIIIINGLLMNFLHSSSTFITD